MVSVCPVHNRNMVLRRFFDVDVFDETVRLSIVFGEEQCQIGVQRSAKLFPEACAQVVLLPGVKGTKIEVKCWLRHVAFVLPLSISSRFGWL